MNFYDMMLQLEFTWPKPTLKNHGFMDTLGDAAIINRGQGDYIRYFLGVLQELSNKISYTKNSLDLKDGNIAGLEVSAEELNNLEQWINYVIKSWEPLTVGQNNWTKQESEKAKNLLTTLDRFVQLFRQEHTRSELFQSPKRKQALRLLNKLLDYIEYVMPHLQKVINIT